MAISSILRVFAVPPARTGFTREGNRPYSITEAQCALLDENGAVVGVGSWNVPAALLDQVKPGDYAFSFAARVSRDGKIEAQITGLIPIAPLSGHMRSGEPAKTPAHTPAPVPAKA